MSDEFRVPDRIAAMGDEGLILVLFWGYSPYEPYPEGCAEVSAYYFQSHEAYRYTSCFIARLRETGIDASMDMTTDLKSLIESKKLAWRGRNDLMYTEEFGSFFVMQAVRVGKANARLMPNTIREYEQCGSCRICENACPSQAINLQGGIEPNNCLRSLMNRATGTDKELAALGTRLYGCDICQRVCPKNKAVKSVPVPADRAELFRIDKLLDLAEQPNPELLARIGECIGYNLARPMRLAALAAAIAVNMGDKVYADTLKRLAQHKDIKIAANARRELP